jgi:hypothetical protein
MTGGASTAPKITYDLRAAQGFAAPSKTIKGQLAIPEPTAVAMLETQRFLFSPAKDVPGFADALWADSIPKLLQARLIESFENYDIAHAPLRAADIGQTDFQLLVDVRRFRLQWIQSRRPRSDCRRGFSTEAEKSSRRACLGRAKKSTRSSRRQPSPRSTMRSVELRRIWSPGPCKCCSSGRIGQPTLFEGLQI